MAETTGPRDDRVAARIGRQSGRLSPETTTLLITALSLLCWLLLIVLGKGLWSAVA